MSLRSGRLRRRRIEPMSPRRRTAYITAYGRTPSSTLWPRQPPPGPDQPTVEAVLERAAWCCERCGAGLRGARGVGWSVHHRRRRAHGGGDGPTNLVALCGDGTGGCHGWAHAHPRRARAEGWLLARGAEPAAVPVRHAMHGQVLLVADATVRRWPAAADAPGASRAG